MAQDIVAFDLGSRNVKAGSIMDASPSVVIPAVVGRRTATSSKSRLLRKTADATASDAPSVMSGDAAIAQLRMGTPMTFGSPIERGVVTNWDDMEHIFNECFTELLRDPKELSVVVAVPPYNPKSYTERLMQTMFESFEVERFATVPQGLCALYASGRTTGVVLDVGHGITTVTPVFDSYPIENAMNRMNTGGADVTDHLRRLLFERGYTFTTPLDVENLIGVKDGVAMVAADYDAALAQAEAEYEVSHELPDGSSVTVGRERFRCAEVLFNPSIVHSEHLGLSEFVAEAIKKCAIDTRRALSGSVVVTGGTSLMPGFGGRVQDDLERHFPGMFGSVHVLQPSDRMNNVWSGAQVLANMSTFEPYFITRDVYDEHGPEIVHNYYNHEARADDDGSSDEEAPPPPPPDD